MFIYVPSKSLVNDGKIENVLTHMIRLNFSLFSYSARFRFRCLYMCLGLYAIIYFRTGLKRELVRSCRSFHNYDPFHSMNFRSPIN